MLLENIKDIALWAIDHGGYAGAAVMMALESMLAPVPSEVVMPPMGMRLHPDPVTGIIHFTWAGAILATTLGSLVGSLISYWLGYVGGKPLVLKVGRWFLLDEHHLDATTRFFNRWGGGTVFISRFVPVVRHFISIPAGLARMNIVRFCLYTIAGAATLWNTFLLWIGWHLQAHWDTVMAYRRPLDAAIVVLLVGVVVGWYWMRLRHARHPSTLPTEQQPDAPAVAARPKPERSDAVDG